MNFLKLTMVWLAIGLLGAVRASQAQTTNLTQEILHLHAFREGLVWIGNHEPDNAENQELLEVLQHLNESWWTTGVEQFLSDYPASPWAASLRHTYASFCHRTGRTTKALEQWEAAWALAKVDPSPQARQLAGSILANWMDLLASLGRLEKLKELIAAGDQWHFVNSQDRDMFQGAKHSYYVMLSHPGISYRCGTFALKAVGQKLQPGNHALDELVAIPSPTNGFSMAALTDLAKQYGLNLVAVRRPAGHDFIVPSVVHWRQNHYAAIVGQQDDLFLVDDPTFGQPKWMAAEVINEEASGEFLVPAAQLSDGWGKLARNQIEPVHGMGLKNSIPDGPDIHCFRLFSGKTLCYKCTGMPVWWVSEPYINLWISDQPLSYLTSCGEPFTFQISYKQRDTRPNPVDAEIANTGWNNSWFSYIHLEAVMPCSPLGCDATLANSTASVFLADGGEVDFAPSQSYDPRNRLLLQVVTPGYTSSSVSDNGLNGLMLVHADGSQDIYGQGVFTTAPAGDYAVADYVLTRHIDQHGNVTVFQLGYTNSVFVQQYVIDSDGRTNTMTYTSGGLLSKVTNPYGLTAQFKYDASRNLTNITDAAGLSSTIKYDTNGYPTALITPYGTNQFFLTDSGATYGGGTNYGNAGGDTTPFLIDRSALTIDPSGATNLYIYRYDSGGVLTTTTFTNVPSGTPLGTLDTGMGTNDDGLNAIYFRNSFHWGPRQYANLSTQNITNFLASDYLLGGMKHWLQDTNDLILSDLISVERDPSPSPSGSVEGLKTFYDYQGKTFSYRAGTNPLPSVKAWCLPGGETHYEYLAFDYFGNITNDVTTCTLPNGTAGTRTNQFIYAGNTYTNLLGGLPSGTPVFYWNNIYTVPNLLTKVIGTDGNSIWSYGGFDLVAVTNYFLDRYGDTNVVVSSWTRVLPDYATNGVGQVAATTFTGFDKITSVTSGAGLTTTNFYNGNGFLAQAIELQTGRTNSFGYTTNGLIGAFTNELGLNLTATWDNLLRLTSVQYPDGTYVSNLYNKLDLGGERDRLGNWITYGYDGARHLISVTNANQAVTSYSWCGCGALTGILDALTNVTSFSYDNQGNLTVVALPDGSLLYYNYDLAGRMTNFVDGADRSLQLGYNNQSLVTTVSNTFGPLRLVNFDIRDRPTCVTDANGIAITNTFDLLDRILTRTWPDGVGEGNGYSAQGLAWHTNRDRQVTGYGRDAAGRLLTVTNANHEVNQFVYDPASDLTNLVDGLNHTTAWQYNQYGWLTNQLDGRGSNVFRYGYNANGWVTNRWTPQNGNAGYTYDNAGNLKAINYFASSIGYAYDALNRLTNMLDAVGTTAWTYTPVGQLASETGPWTGATVTNTYTQGLRTTLSILQSGGAWSQSYGYDAQWRLTGLTSPAGAFGYTYGFQPASSLVTAISLPNAANINNSYDTLARLRQTALVNYWGHTLDAASYIPDPLGLRTNLVRSLGLTTNFVNVGYDNIGQLTSWSGAETSGGLLRQNEQLGFSYDAAHNLNLRTNGALLQTFNVDAANELTSVSRTGTFTESGATPSPATNLTVNGNTAQLYGDFTFARTNLALLNGNNSFTNIALFAYTNVVTNTFTVNLPTNVSLAFDYNGNLTNDGTRLFAYDQENQLTNIMIPGQWQSSFAYDGLHRRRIARDFTWTNSAWLLANEVHYIYDGLLLVQERDTNGNPLVTYTRGLDLSGSINGAGGIGGLLARTDTNGSTYYHADGSGNITALMDGNENIVARYLYNPYGKLLGQWGVLANANAMQFSSMPQRRGIPLFPFRGYEPNFQRWLNRDPIEEWGGYNLYEMTDNNPVNEFDPLGLDGAAAGVAMRSGLTYAGEEEVAGLGPEDPVADAAAIATLIGAAGYATYEYFQPAKPTICEMGKRPSRNKDRIGHKGGNDSETHEDAQGHGGRQKPNFTPKPKRPVQPAPPTTQPRNPAEPPRVPR